jgi:hypothetical protein
MERGNEEFLAYHPNAATDNKAARDGKWTMKPPYSRTVREMFGLRIADEPSEPHPTFLASLALTYYRDQIRAEGINLVARAE